MVRGAMKFVLPIDDSSRGCRYAGSTRVFSRISPRQFGTLRRRLKNVIRHGRMGSGNAIEDVIKGNLSAFRIAVLAVFDQLFGFAEGWGSYENDYLFF